MSQSELSNKTILQVLPSLISGGVERGSVEVAKELKKRKYISLLASAGGPMLEQVKEYEISHIKMALDSKNPCTIYQNASNLCDIINKYNVNLIHARSRAPAWSCFLAAKRTKTPFITTFHGIYDTSIPLKRLYNSIMTKGEVVIAVSDFVKQHIIENYSLDSKKIRVIHRGVDLEYFNKNNLTPQMILQFKDKYRVLPETPVILMPARMTEWKGHATVIEALNKLKHLNFYCIMVGDSSKHPGFTRRISELIADYKLHGKVQIFGNESNMLGLYGISDIVLSPSILPEAFGRVVIEGQAMEKLVIATNVGGAVETITDRVSGYHVTPNNVLQLAEAIEHCLAIYNTTEASIISSNARSSVAENFSLQAMLDKTIQLYNEML